MGYAWLNVICTMKCISVTTVYFYYMLIEIIMITYLKKLSTLPTKRDNDLPLLNMLRPRKNDYFPDNIFKCSSWMKMYQFRLKFHKFVPKGPINNIPTLGEMMAWLWPGNKPLSETMMVWLLMKICITQLNELTENSHVTRNLPKINQVLYGIPTGLL